MRYVLFLDLIDDAELIETYKAYHQQIPAHIETTIKASGILSMQIYQTGTRMAMIKETTPDFSFENKTKADLEDPQVQAWEKLTWQFQQSLPHAGAGEKWMIGEKIFDLLDQKI